MLAVAAAGTYVIYVVLTCLFYFVGLAYENVSEVTRFILFMGAIDSCLYAARRALGAGSCGSRRLTWRLTTRCRSVRKPRLLILIVAYNAEKTIGPVLSRVPHRLAEEYDVEVLVLDDSSQDRTFEQTRDAQRSGGLPFPVHVLFNPVNQGYGGNQKIGYHFAIEQGFDFVALVHGDGQYAPECLPDLVRPCVTATPTQSSDRGCSRKAARAAAACRCTSSSATEF